MTAQPLRSRNWFGRKDLDGFAHRSWLRTEGFSDLVFDGRPVIGIANSWSELTNCNAHLAAGGRRFPVPAPPGQVDPLTRRTSRCSPLNGPNGGGNVEGRWESIHRKRWMKGFGGLELSTKIHKARRWRGQRPVTLAVSRASRSCPHVHRYPQALELHGGNAVGRLRSPKATVHSSTASTGLRILPFDGPARASIGAHTHLTRANEALTSPMAWRLCWASRSKLLA
jgi:hypothetical protein